MRFLINNKNKSFICFFTYISESIDWIVLRSKTFYRELKNLYYIVCYRLFKLQSCKTNNVTKFTLCMFKVDIMNYHFPKKFTLNIEIYVIYKF